MHEYVSQRNEHESQNCNMIHVMGASIAKYQRLKVNLKMIKLNVSNRIYYAQIVKIPLRC